MVALCTEVSFPFKMNNQRRISVPHQAPKKHVPFKYSSILNITRRHKLDPKSTLGITEQTVSSTTQTRGHSDKTNTCTEKTLVSSTKCITNSGHHCKPCHLKFHLHVPNFLKFHHHHHSKQVQRDVRTDLNETKDRKEYIVVKSVESPKDNHKTNVSFDLNGDDAEKSAVNLFKSTTRPGDSFHEKICVPVKYITKKDEVQKDGIAKTGSKQICFTQTDTNVKTTTCTEYKNYTSAQRRRIFSKFGHMNFDPKENREPFITTKLSRWDEADEIREG